MSKWIVLVLLLPVLVGCRYVSAAMWEASGEPPAYDIPVPDYEVESVAGVMHWVSANVEYRADLAQYGLDEYWATPEETYSAGGGDCEDYATLAIYLLWRDLGIQAEVILAIDRRSGGGHVLVDHDGDWWEPQTDSTVPPEEYLLVDRLSAAQALARCG